MYKNIKYGTVRVETLCVQDVHFKLFQFSLCSIFKHLELIHVLIDIMITLYV